METLDDSDGEDSDSDASEYDAPPATEAQLNLLLKLGVGPDDLCGINKWEAMNLISDLRSRPTEKQIMCLVRNGMNAEKAMSLTAQEANARIAKLAEKQGWGRKA